MLDVRVPGVKSVNLANYPYNRRTKAIAYGSYSHRKRTQENFARHRSCKRSLAWFERQCWRLTGFMFQGPRAMGPSPPLEALLQQHRFKVLDLDGACSSSINSERLAAD